MKLDARSIREVLRVVDAKDRPRAKQGWSEGGGATSSETADLFKESAQKFKNRSRESIAR